MQPSTAMCDYEMKNVANQRLSQIDLQGVQAQVDQEAQLFRRNGTRPPHATDGQGKAEGTGADILTWAILGNRAQGGCAERELEEEAEDCGDAREVEAFLEAEAKEQKGKTGKGSSAAEGAARGTCR